jgi:hypothetical protein
MSGRHSSIVVAIGLAAATPGFAGDADAPAFTPRQMAHCMMKRARANTAEPYRDAYKACKNQFESARSERAAENAVTAAALPETEKR